MNASITAALSALLLGAVLVATPAAAVAQSAATTSTANAAPAAAPNGPPAGFVAPADPKPDENNAQRSKTQPGNNAPFWRGVRETGQQSGTINLPGAEKGVLIQSFVQYPGSRLTTAGEAWRQVRNQWLLPYGGAFLLIVLGAIGIFYFWKGRLGHADGNGPGQIERFTPFERSAHWFNAITFCILAVSGLVMAFGKFVLLPVMGHTLFGWLTYVLKTAHNFAGPVFAVSLVIVIVTFIRDNLPAKGDLRWMLKGGGLLGEHEVPSNRFNAGEKLIFWAGVFLCGLVAVGSGLLLDKLIPGFGETRAEMQVYNMIHVVATVAMMALFAGHIYIGTIGMKGAYRAMRTGYVDAEWAKEHHEWWYEDIAAGRIPAQRSQPTDGTAPGGVLRPSSPAA